MRRKEKEITEKSGIEDIIRKAVVCRLGLADGNMPYVVPLCFGYKNHTLYIHSALKGKKIDILRRNPEVCFEFDADIKVREAENPCEWGMKFQSVIGYGKAFFIEDSEEKRAALDTIMRQYCDKAFQFPDKSVNGIAVIRIEISSMSGKRSGF